MCQAGGLAVRVQELQRYYAFLIDREKTKIIWVFEGANSELAQVDSGREFGLPYDLNLQVDGSRLVSSINGRFVLEAENLENMYNGGGIALIAEVDWIAMEQLLRVMQKKYWREINTAWIASSFL